MSVPDWPRLRIGEVVDFFDSRRIPLSKMERQLRQGRFPYYGASGVIDYLDDYLFDGRYLLVAEDGENLNSRKLPVAFFATGQFWVNNHAHVLRGKSGLIDDVYLQAWFANTNLSPFITGAAQPKLSQANLKRITLPVPPLMVQRQMAAVLSAYDELIENNTRRIQILEEMARTIYREWFVEFRYPGHGNVPSIESDRGLIPEGWSVKPLADVATIVMGQSPSSEFYNVQGDGLPFHQGVTNFGRHFPSNRTFTTVGDRLAEAGDVLFSVRAPVGRINVATCDLVLGRGLCAIRGTSDVWALLLSALLDQFQELDTMGSGAIFNSVKKSDMQGIRLVWPSDDLVSQFNAITEPMFALLRTLTTQAEHLRQARDLLLPRLISGELDVSELDIEGVPAA